MEELEKILEPRIKRGSYPPFWNPRNEGDKLVGTVTMIRGNPWQEGMNLYHIKEITTGKEYTTPGNVVLIRMLTEEGVQVGDLVYIKYVGKQPSKRGRSIKLYEVAVMKKDEFERLKKERPEIFKKLTKTEIREKAVEEPTVAPKPVEEAGIKLPEGVDKAKADEIRGFVKELFGFYSKIRKEDLNNYVNNVRQYNIPIELVLEICKDICVLKDDGFVYKK